MVGWIIGTEPGSEVIEVKLVVFEEDGKNMIEIESEGRIINSEGEIVASLISIQNEFLVHGTLNY